ncbi:MAG: AMP-binding protein, partial [Acidimicrobiales bacterium]
MLTYEEAAAAITAPGERFEIETIEVEGVPVKAFKHAPPSLREIFASARARGDDTFLVYEDERWSFAEVMAHVDALAALLVDGYGIVPGDRVAIGMRNYPEWVIAFAAITSVGAISVSLNAWWTADELDYALEDSGASVLIADVERVERGHASAARLGCRVLAVRARGDLPEGVDRWEDVRELGAPMPDIVVTPDHDATILYTS